VGAHQVTNEGGVSHAHLRCVEIGAIERKRELDRFWDLESSEEVKVAVVWCCFNFSGSTVCMLGKLCDAGEGLRAPVAPR
jgi:hypothetical protein